MDPVERCVRPLMEDAIRRAEEEAKVLVSRVQDQLKAAGYDLNVCAPYPETKGWNQTKATQYQLFRKLTQSRKSSIRRGEPNFADMSSKKVHQFIEDAKERTGFQYLAFMEKLRQKIGPVDEAEIEGSHVWGYSILMVKKGEVIEHWKTHMIVNVSKFGEPFNQWPTRKVRK